MIFGSHTMNSSTLAARHGPRPALRHRLTVLAVGVATLAVVGSGCSTPATVVTPPGTPASIDATPFVQMAPNFPDTVFEGTTMEGPAFGPDGALYMVNASAPAGQPKVLRLDTRTKEVRGVYTDQNSVLSSAQFSPVDQRLYVTEFTTGAVLSMRPDGSAVKTVFRGEVASGQRVATDDLTFDRSGAMYLSDAGGSLAVPTGRLVRIEPDGSKASVLASGLHSVNGIAFAPDQSHLWISEYANAQVDYLTLSKDRRTVTDATVAFRPDLGSTSLDSLAVDSAGNIYQTVWDAGKVLVWDPQGNQVATIVLSGAPATGTLRTTNLAIRPGTRDGYLTASGPAGGWVYRFDAVADGAAQSNGG